MYVYFVCLCVCDAECEVKYQHMNGNGSNKYYLHMRSESHAHHRSLPLPHTSSVCLNRSLAPTSLPHFLAYSLASSLPLHLLPPRHVTHLHTLLAPTNHAYPNCSPSSTPTPVPHIRVHMRARHPSRRSAFWGWCYWWNRLTRRLEIVLSKRGIPEYAGAATVELAQSRLHEHT